MARVCKSARDLILRSNFSNVIVLAIPHDHVGMLFWQIFWLSCLNSIGRFLLKTFVVCKNCRDRIVSEIQNIPESIDTVLNSHDSIKVRPSLSRWLVSIIFEEVQPLGCYYAGSEATECCLYASGPTVCCLMQRLLSIPSSFISAHNPSMSSFLLETKYHLVMCVMHVMFEDYIR